MTNEEVNAQLNKIIDKEYQWMLDNISQNIAKDKMSEYNVELLHFILLELYNKSPEYKIKLMNDDKVKYWVITSAGLQLRSSTSPFYRAVRREKMHARSGALPEIAFEAYEPEMWDCYQSGMESLSFYYRKLVEEKFLNSMSFDDISKKYQISKVHIKRDLVIAIDLLRNHCKHV